MPMTLRQVRRGGGRDASYPDVNGVVVATDTRDEGDEALCIGLGIFLAGYVTA